MTAAQFLSRLVAMLDAAGILRVKQAALDRDYIDSWARALGVVGLWQ